MFTSRWYQGACCHLSHESVMKWPICWSSPGDRGITYTLQPADTHTHTRTKLNHMLEVDMHLTPLCQSASVLSYFSFHFPLLLCPPSVFSEAFYYVTQTDSTWQPTTPFVPHLCCCTWKKLVAFVLQSATWHLYTRCSPSRVIHCQSYIKK